MIPAPKIVLITDPRYPLAYVTTTIEAAASALAPGDLLVQLRDKREDASRTLSAARALRDVTRALGMSFVVNGDATLAQAVGADGAHLGKRPSGARPDIASARAIVGDDAFISIAAHTDEDVTYAVSNEATAVLVSPIFDSPGKGPPRGVAALERARAIANDEGRPELLVYALGGIDDRRAAACSDADGVAVIRALLDAPDARVSAVLLAAPFAQRRR